METVCPVVTSNLDLSQFYLDIGYSITRSNDLENPYTLLWDGHCITNIWYSAAKRLPVLDPWCYTRDVFGFHGHPAKTIERATHCIYAQFYHLEKEGTYLHSGKSIVSSLSPKDFLDDPNILKPLQDAWDLAANKSWGCRMEWRVRLEAAMSLLSQDISGLLDNLKSIGAVYIVPNQDVLLWKTARLSGFRQVLDILHPPRALITVSEKRLVWLSTYLIKSLVQRPQEDSYTKDFLRLVNLKVSLHSLGYSALKKDLIDFEKMRMLEDIDSLGIDSLQAVSKKGGASVKHIKKKVHEDCSASLRESQINIPAVDLSIIHLGTLAVNDTVLNAVDEVLKMFFFAIWETFPSTGKADPLAPYPSFRKEEVDRYCVGCRFLQPASGSTSARNWDWYFNAFFKDSSLLKGKSTKYVKVDTAFQQYEFLNLLMVKDFPTYKAVLVVLEQVFYSWEVIPASSGGKIWTSVNDKGRKMYNFAQRGRQIPKN